MTPPTALYLTWAIAALATAGVIVRPWRIAEAVWAVAGAGLLVALGLVPAREALGAILHGQDVYLFLIGMMLLAEIARREGLFDVAAAFAVNRSGGSPRRLLLLVYAVGVAVTVFLSNDATAVVLTPAVYAAARKARTDPLPHLVACALVANAASFVLPISNPANLVLYGGRTPPLGAWLASFALPSLVAVVATYLALRWAERSRLDGLCERDVPQPALGAGAVTALAGLGVTALVLLAASAFNLPLGLPTAVMGVLTVAAVLLRERATPVPVLRDVSWSVLPLVAGLFVLVQALDRTGVVAVLAAELERASRASAGLASVGAGALLALACNLMNNLPAGMIASAAAARAHPPAGVVDGLLIGVDLGPNLSVTGSLATILWLTAIRREGGDVGFWRFLRTGAVVAPPALALALGARLLLH
ncbi:MAG: Citrate transporter [Caulobacteraceae bacterium]|nr:Citrate transporter [Caulobacteraceae bacterium]